MRVFSLPGAVLHLKWQFYIFAGCAIGEALRRLFENAEKMRPAKAKLRSPLSFTKRGISFKGCPPTCCAGLNFALIGLSYMINTPK